MTPIKLNNSTKSDSNNRKVDATPAKEFKRMILGMINKIKRTQTPE
jgi:hypothetical protein